LMVHMLSIPSLLIYHLGFANISKKMDLSAEKDAYARPGVSDTISLRRKKGAHSVIS
jgi:hypothetical protein